MNNTAEIIDMAQKFSAAAENFGRTGDANSQGEMRTQRVLITRALLLSPVEEILGTLPALTIMARACLKSGLCSAQRVEIENQMLALCQSQDLKTDASQKAITTGLAALLLCWHPCELGLVPDFAQVPAAVLPIWLDYLFELPPAFANPGDADRYAAYLEALCLRVDEHLARSGERSDELAQAFAASSMFMQSYFTEGNLRPTMRARGAVLERILERGGAVLDQLRVVAPIRKKPRIGFISLYLTDGTETVFLAAQLERLNRQRYDVRLYSCLNPNGSVAHLCRASADTYVQLPLDINEAVARLRRDDLDIAIFCSNLTAIKNEITEIAAHRIARIQASTIATPVTTGLRNVDVMISGSANEPPGADAHYVERLVRMDGSLNCYPFQYLLKGMQAKTQTTRAMLGIPDGAPLFCSAAVYYKIVPELSAQWIDILRQVENSRLLLMPFNLTWSSTYPRAPFVARLNQQLAAANVATDRVRLLEFQPTVADLHGVLRLADVYLDAYPFSGACSVYDPLEVGLPVVARSGPVCRSRHSAAMLQEIGLGDWVTSNAAAYVERAVALGRDPARRNAERERLAQARATGFAFTDTARYAAKLAPVLDGLVADWQTHAGGLRDLPATELAGRVSTLAADAARLMGGFTNRDMIANIVLPYLRSGGSRRLIDVGAHRGVMTQPFLDDGWQAVMFEPDVRVHPALDALVARYPGQVRYEPAAVIALSPYVARQGLFDADFIKIDAAGNDFGIVEGIDFARLTPRLMMVEFADRFPGQDRASVERVVRHMRTKGYRAAVFCFLALGESAPVDGHTNLRTIAIDAVPTGPKGKPLFGDILFFSEDDRGFVASLIDWLELTIARGQQTPRTVVAPTRHASTPGDADTVPPKPQDAPLPVTSGDDAPRQAPVSKKDRVAAKQPKQKPLNAKRAAQINQIFNLAVQHHRENRLADAEKLYRKVLGLDPANSPALNNLGLLVSTLGRPEEGEALFKRACAPGSNNADAHLNLGNCFQNRGDHAEAVASYERAIKIKPNSPGAYVNLGNSYRTQGKVEQAIASYEQALRIDPNMAEALIDMGTLYNKLRRGAEAVKLFERAVQIRPDFAAAHNNLGCTLLDLGRHDEAVTHLETAIRLRPDNLDAYLNLGNMLTDLGRNDEAAGYYQKILAIEPERPSAVSNSVFSLNYSDRIDPLTLAQRHFQMGERIEQNLRGAPRVFRNSLDPKRKLRVGYISPDFRTHAVAFFLEPLIRAHDRNAVELFCYAEVFSPDGMTERLKGMVDHWFSTVGVRDDDVAARIREDEIDILVDLAGHSAHNRLAVLARRPAPVQMTWLGYPNTTGLKSVDYRLVDAVSDPEGPADPLASETLVRLEGGFLCYQPLPQAPDPMPPPCLQTGTVTFGSFNNLAKLSPTTFDTWSLLLKRVPTARLLLKTRYFGAAGTRASVLSRFTDRGVSAERITLLDGIPDLAAHLATYHQVDIGLDSLPYNGTTTTCEALWMGIPVVTLAGDRHLARVGASLVTRVGLTELIARDQQDYVDIAARLAADLPRLTNYHKVLRTRMASSSICDERGFARKVEAAYRELWQRWCNQALAPKTAVG